MKIEPINLQNISKVNQLTADDVDEFTAKVLRESDERTAISAQERIQIHESVRQGSDD